MQGFSSGGLCPGVFVRGVFVPEPNVLFKILILRIF